MAELIQVRLRDFRAFREASLDIAPKGLNLVTGPNNSGKSSLLSAFDVIAGVDTAADLRHSLGERARVWGRFRLSVAERSALLGPTPDLAQLLDQGAAEWLEWEFADNDNRMLAVAIRLNWTSNQLIDIASCEFSGNSWNLQAISNPLSTGRFELAGLGGGSISGGPVPDPLINLASIPVLQPIGTVLPDWRESFFHFRPLRQSTGRESRTSEILPILRSDGTNLPAVLLHMFTNYPSTWQNLKELLTGIVPDVGDLMTPINNNSFQVVFGHGYSDHADSSSADSGLEYYRHNLKDLGTGVEQILMILVVGLTQTATTVLIEEPETGLHPGAQRALLSLLQGWSKSRLFFAATHSSTMLDWSSPADTAIYAVKRSPMESKVETVELTSDLADVLWELGVRLSDVLSAERILIHEGPTDGDILTTWFPVLLRDPRIVMIPGGGGANARHADLVASWIQSADGLGNRKLLYIRDRDEIGGSILEKLEASPNVYVLSCREIENFLLDFDAATQVINTYRQRSGSPEVSADTVALQAKVLADQLKQTGVLRGVIQERLGALYLLDNRTREDLVSSNANAEDLIAAVVSRIPQEGVLRRDIEASWIRQEQEIDNVWEQEWRSLVPGADLLTKIWQEYVGQGYSKSIDGPLIAARISPPEELAQAVRSFIAEA